nr:MAG TPA: hypothetical protein [Caudoviricetes sp.]
MRTDSTTPFLAERECVWPLGCASFYFCIHTFRKRKIIARYYFISIVYEYINTQTVILL